YIKGVADFPNQEIEILFTGKADDTNLTISKRLPTDERGVFSEVVSLVQLCEDLPGSQIALTIQTEKQVLVEDVSLECGAEDQTKNAISQVTLGGMSVEDLPLQFVEGANMTLGLS